MKRTPLLLILVLFLFFSAAAWAALEKAGYDLFTPTMAYAPSNSVTKKIASEFLTYPFELVRWPLNKALVFLEENRIPAKTRYIFDQLEAKGIVPKVSFRGVGAEFNLPRLLRLEDELPETLVAKNWIMYAPERLFETGAKLGFRPAEASGFQSLGTFKYDVRPEEDFFGIGPDTSRGDETVYKMETTTLEAMAGYRYETDFALNARVGYRNINISEPEEDDIFIREVVYPGRPPVSGLHGDNLINLGMEAAWVPEANENKITVPGKARIGADYVEGVGDSDARYLKVFTEMVRNVNLGSERREFAARFYGEQNTPLGEDGKVPFHQMAKLGGFSPFYSLSQTLRSYHTNRFTAESAALLNLEYRYRIYEYREWTLAHVLFLDEGQTFRNFGSFQLKDFRESYGTGLRLKYLHHTILNLEVAHGDEGTAFHIRNSQSF